MSEAEEKITNLEELILELQLDSHASRVAIAVLSSALNGVIGKGSNLGDIYISNMDKLEEVEFSRAAPDGYREKLHQKVAALLGHLED